MTPTHIGRCTVTFRDGSQAIEAEGAAVYFGWLRIWTSKSQYPESGTRWFPSDVIAEIVVAPQS